MFGRWGEELVFRLLEAGGGRDSGGGGGGGDEVVEWVNADGESGLPYDIVISRCRRRAGDGSGAGAGTGSGAGGAGEGGGASAVEDGSAELAGGAGDERVFVEVKSTLDPLGPDAGPRPFPLSVNQLLFALRHGPRFQVRDIGGVAGLI
jgi:hypothetical protein